MAEIKLFQDKKIRTLWDERKEDWWFSVVDVVGVLTDSADPTQYLKRLRSRDNELNSYIGTNCTHVEMVNSNLKLKKKIR